jgi:hypothetical protein
VRFARRPSANRDAPFTAEPEDRRTRHTVETLRHPEAGEVELRCLDCAYRAILNDEFEARELRTEHERRVIT